MSNYISIQSSNDVIEHFGTKGMRWGHRKSKEFYTKKYINKGYHPRHAREMAQRKMVLNKRLKTGAKIVGGVALAGLAAYGAYKGLNHLQTKAARQAVEELARKERNKRIWEEMNKNDKSLDALHKRGESVKDLFRKRAEEINNLNKGWAGSSASKKAAADTIRNRHEYAGKEMKRVFENITKSDATRDARIDKQFNQIDDLLRDLSGGGTTRRGANGRRIKDVTNSLRG